MMLLVSKLPKDIKYIILSYTKKGWIFDKKERIRMILSNQRLKNIKLTFCYLLVNSRFDLNNDDMHLTTCKYITSILTEICSYMKGYTLHHKLLIKCLNLTVYYMKRKGDTSRLIDKDITIIQYKMQQQFIKHGYKKKLLHQIDSFEFV